MQSSIIISSVIYKNKDIYLQNSECLLIKKCAVVCASLQVCVNESYPSLKKVNHKRKGYGVWRPEKKRKRKLRRA